MTVGQLLIALRVPARCFSLQADGPGGAQGGEKTAEEEVGEERYPSVVPFLPPLTDATIREYFRFYIASVGTLVLFGGLLAPMLEVRLGLGGARPAERGDLPVYRPARLVGVDEYTRPKNPKSFFTVLAPRAWEACCMGGLKGVFARLQCKHCQEPCEPDSSG